MSPKLERQPGFLETWGTAVASATVLLLVLMIWGAGAIGDALHAQPVELNPFLYLFALLEGRRTWPGTPSTAVLAGAGLGVLAAAVAAARFGIKRRNQPTTIAEVDRAARKLAHPRDLYKFSPAGVAESAARLRPGTRIDPNNPAQHGRYLGDTVIGSMPVRASLEDLGVHIWGPRTRKTMAMAVPMVVDAEGPVIATTNKRDLADHTRGPRNRRGNVWVFDVQQIVDEPQQFWVNPFDRIRSISDATVVAGHFITGTRDADAKTDSYFDGSAESLVAAYMLAATRDGGTLIDVYEWLANSTDRAPWTILGRDEGDRLAAAEVESILSAPEKQRMGVYDTALKLLRCLRNPDVLKWVIPPKDTGIPKIDLDEFVRSKDTLYLLSMEGKDSASPLVAALTEHTCHTAVRYANTQPLGRLDPTMTAVLDEAANVCRWRELPALYSHFGSRGINIETILQTWYQGLEVWGTNGMEMLWGAANVRTYGGGGASPEFLRRLMELAGRADQQRWTRTLESRGGRSHSAGGSPEDILPVDRLAGMPPGRALVVASGARPFIIKTRPWWEGSYAEEINASLHHYDPGMRALTAAGKA